jgi:nitroimidazol reductase NimA-like FMN-containing flavoprotein (pyridoxamine 5'-phosphate oxidase superfamily)
MGAGHPPDPGLLPATDTAAIEPGTITDAAAFERRAFVRRMTTDAVGIAGGIFSLSRVLRRSAAAAGQAVANELEGLQLAGAQGTASSSADRPESSAGEPGTEAGVPDALGSSPAPSPPAAFVATTPFAPSPPSGPTEELPLAPATPPRPALLMDAEQIALLEAATVATVAVNWEGHPPQLTAASVLWDGEALRFATLGWSRRTTMLRADPRIGLLVEGPGDGRFVSVAGQAEIAEGHDAREAMWPLLLREAGEGGEAALAAAEARWLELVAADPDRAVIVVHVDQVLSGRR